MANKKLVVVDMQKDFTYMALENPMAVEVIDKIAEKIESFDGEVIFTYDTHHENYLETAEGRKLPVAHCIENTEGWQLVDKLDLLRRQGNCRCFNKPAFGSVELADTLSRENKSNPIDEIELVGVCTDICVISNAMLLKAFMPEVLIKADASCCAGVTRESHDNALKAMECCHIDIIND